MERKAPASSTLAMPMLLSSPVPHVSVYCSDFRQQQVELIAPTCPHEGGYPELHTVLAWKQLPISNRWDVDVLLNCLLAAVPEFWRLLYERRWELSSSWPTCIPNQEPLVHIQIPLL